MSVLGFLAVVHLYCAVIEFLGQLLAIQILGVSDPDLAAKLDEKKAKDAAAVLAKDKALQDELNG